MVAPRAGKTFAGSSTWQALLRELDRWSERSSIATFWFRDDDACAVTPQLERLRDLADRHGVEIALAVIPGQLESALVRYLRVEGSPFHAMCHGWRHIDYGPNGRPGEFGPDRPLSALREDAKLAFDEFANHFGRRAVVFVPPYGRITKALTSELPQIGFWGVSTGPTNAERRLARLMAKVSWSPSIRLNSGRSTRHFDVHVDSFDWTRRTARTTTSVAREIVGHLRLRRNGFVAPGAPIGLLMHHLVHDEATWDLYDGFLEATTAHSAVRFARIGAVIGLGTVQLTET